MLRITNRPFLKWAGNKYHIIDDILRRLPEGQRLIEPFAGSGAVFLNTAYESYHLADVNPDLVNLFLHVRDDGASFVEFAATFFDEPSNTAEVYYERRSMLNACAESRLRAALFIYLNRHCFNGLCRYNQRGQFNTPFGRYKKPYFPRAELIEFHRKSANLSLAVSDFTTTMDLAVVGDVVYCDPPYLPLSDTSNFTSYSQAGFSLEQQQALAAKAVELADKGITVVISNHDTPYARRLYAAADLHFLQAPRFISANAAGRGAASELLAVFGRPLESIDGFAA